LLTLLPQVVQAELRFTSPERAAGMHDYVREHVVCEDGTCGQAAEPDTFDELPLDACSPEGGSCAERWWVRADYLLWWIQGNRLPPLVTMNPTGGPPTGLEPVLFGGESVDNDLRHGVRTSLGVWLDDAQDWGLEGHYFYVGNAAGGYQAASDGDPILARPFFDAGVPDAQWIALPGWSTGQIRIDTSSDAQSAGLLLRRAWLQGCQGQIAVLGGYRYFRFRERLTIDEDLLLLDAISVQSRDEFAVQNDFHGAEIGLAAALQHGRWSLDALTKLGLGGVRQRLDIGGRTESTTGGVQEFGLLAQASNIGHASDTEFAFLPELGVNVGYGLTSSLSLRAGYSLLWLTDALRTGDQVDLDIGGPAPMDTTSICVQGINLGVEWRR